MAVSFYAKSKDVPFHLKSKLLLKTFNILVIAKNNTYLKRKRSRKEKNRKEEHPLSSNAFSAHSIYGGLQKISGFSHSKKLLYLTLQESGCRRQGFNTDYKDRNLAPSSHHRAEQLEGVISIFSLKGKLRSHSWHQPEEEPFDTTHCK